MKRDVSPDFQKLSYGCPPDSYRLYEDDDKCYDCSKLDIGVLTTFASHMNLVITKGESIHDFCIRIRKHLKDVKRTSYIPKKRDFQHKKSKPSTKKNKIQESEMSPYDILYPSVGKKLKDATIIPLRIIERYFKPQKLKDVFLTVILSIKGEDVWNGNDYTRKRVESDYDYYYDGFEFMVKVYKNRRADGMRVFEVHMSNDGFMYGALNDKFIEARNVEYNHTNSKEWSKVTIDIIAFFKEEINYALALLKWKENDKVVIQAYYNQREMRLDIVCTNESRNWEACFCFEPGFPKYIRSKHPEGTLYSDIQHIQGADYWGFDEDSM